MKRLSFTFLYHQKFQLKVKSNKKQEIGLIGTSSFQWIDKASSRRRTRVALQILANVCHECWPRAVVVNLLPRAKVAIQVQEPSQVYCSHSVRLFDRPSSQRKPMAHQVPIQP